MPSTRRTGTWRLARRTTCSSSDTRWCGTARCLRGSSRTPRANPWTATDCSSACTTTYAPLWDATRAGSVAGMWSLNEDGTMRQTPWLKIIGEDYLLKAFEYAHEADPKAELYYNDYSVENQAKR